MEIALVQYAQGVHSVIHDSITFNDMANDEPILRDAFTNLRLNPTQFWNLTLDDILTEEDSVE